MYFYHPRTGRFEQSTRSAVRATTYGPILPRRSYDDDFLYTPLRYAYSPHYRYDTTSTEYSTHSDVNRELINSTAAMEDNYDISARSRKRDRDVIAAANRAIVDTEVHSSARSAVAASRVARGRSTPPAPVSLSRTEVHVALARASPNTLRYHVPPASVLRRPRFPRVTVRPRNRYWFPVRAARYNKTAIRVAREPSPDFEGLRRAPLSLLAYLRNLELALQVERIRPRSVPVRKAYRKKAALLANKVEVNFPRRRRPKSSYAQEKMRQLRKERHSDGDEYEVAASTEVTTGLKAHAPVYDPSQGKPYWGVEGLRKPNIMSWQYRLDTYASPDDLIIVPRSLNAVRAQLRECHDKLDHHRQLMDRYLVGDKGLSVEDSIVLMNIKNRASNSEPALSTVTVNPMATYKGPMSSARRNARRVLAMTRNDPHYYKPEDK